LNQDKRPELVYAYSWGSGVHRSHVAVFDCLAKEPKEYVAPLANFHMERDFAVKRVDDQTVEVYVGAAKVGQLLFGSKDGKDGVRIELSKDLDDSIKRHIRVSP
jgi:hypothetical protein